MPRWNNSLKDNCKHVLDTVIKNIKPDLYQCLLSELLDANVENNKKIIEQQIRSKLNLTSKLARHTVGYWKARGWSADESYIKSRENTQKNRKSVYSREFWLEKINPVTGLHYTIDEADFERNSRRPIRKEYWISKGYCDDESEKLAVNAKTNNNAKGASKNKGSTVRRITSRRCIEYYLARGYSEDESKKLLSESQKFFSKDICIQKYGEEHGIKVWKDRQDRWQAKLDSKSNDEKSRINRLKISKGITVSKAEKLILKELLDIVPGVVHQFSLFESNKKQYIYDIMYNNKIIEYNGDFWHCNPKKYLADFVNPKTKVRAIDKWKSDYDKIEFAQSQGYTVLVVWESDFKQNKEQTIKECIQFLTQ